MFLFHLFHFLTECIFGNDESDDCELVELSECLLNLGPLGVGRVGLGLVPLAELGRAVDLVTVAVQALVPAVVVQLTPEVQHRGKLSW